MSEISISQQQSVVSLVINRPEKKNSLTRQMYESMAIAIENAEANGAKLIIIEGAGDCFTAGNNIADFANIDDAEHVNETAHFMNALMKCELPVIAKVRGLAVGIGTTMLLHCDFVYCDDSAKFIMPFIDLGLVPEFASSFILPRLAGHRKASEWLMLGKPFDSEEARHFGVVTEVFPAEQLDHMVQTIAHALCEKPRVALRNTKRLMKLDTHTIAEHMNEELDFFIDAMKSEPAQEAFSAFLSKRPINPEKFK